MNTFGDLLRRYRKRSTDLDRNGRHLTQERLGELIGRQLGYMGPAGATISYWESNKSKISHDDRLLLVSIVQVLEQMGGITTLAQADTLLAAGNYRTLDETEIKNINHEWVVQPETKEIIIEHDDAPPPSPYRGLQAFTEADAPFFFGRGGCYKTSY